MTVLDELRWTAGNDFDKIEYVTFNNVYLDLQETYKLLADMKYMGELQDVSSSLVFYGKDFKIQIFEDSYNGLYFGLISLKRPRKTKGFKPLSLKQCWYSEEFGTYIPFKTDEMLKNDEEERLGKERKQKEYAEKQKQDMLVRFKKQRADLEKAGVQDVPDFTIWHNDGNVYAIVPRDFTAQSSGVYLQSDLKDKLPEELRYTVDYVGLCGYDDGKWWLYGMFTDRTLADHADYVRDHYDSMMKDGLLRPVIGISREKIYKVDGLPNDIELAGKELMTKILGYLK